MNGVTDEDFANGFEDGAGFWTWLARKCEGPWGLLWVPVSVILLLIALVVLFVFGLLVTVWDWVAGGGPHVTVGDVSANATERAERAERAESTERDEKTERA